MSEGPIKQWRDGFRTPPVSTTASTALHLMTGPGDRRPYCGHRGKASSTNARPMVTCSACIAAYNADADAAAEIEGQS